jgi:hypothetical protein
MEYLSDTSMGMIQRFEAYNEARPSTRNRWSREGYDKAKYMMNAMYHNMYNTYKNDEQAIKTAKFKEDFKAVAAGLRDP